MNKFLKRMMMLTMIMFLGLLLTACTDDNDYQSDESETSETSDTEEVANLVDEDLVSVDALVADVQARFSREAHYDVIDSVTVPRDHVFEFPWAYEATDAILEVIMDDERGFSHVMRVYRDSALTQPVGASSGGDSENFTYLSIGPNWRPEFYLTESPIEDLEGREGGDDWGNAGQYFLAKYYDLTTGERLARPQVIIFNVETEIPGAPRVTFNVTDDGVAGLRWDPLPGAESYKVIYIAESIDGTRLWRPIVFVTETTETHWDNISILSSGGSRRNHAFRTFDDDDITADELFRDLVESGEMTLEEFEEFHFNFDAEFLYENNIYFAVIGLNSEGTSAISNLIDIRSVAPRIPVSLSTNMNEGGVIPSAYHPSSIVEIEGDLLLAPTHARVIMGDGNVGSRLINYDTDRVIRGTVAGYRTNGRHVLVESPDSPTLLIPYIVEGTHFTGVVQLTDHEGILEADLRELASRQEGLRSRGGDLERTVNLNPKDKEYSDDVVTDEVVATELRSNFEVRASSPLSAYLAIQMFNGQTRISLDDFPEAADHEYLVEAWFEAVLQNPLVLGPRSMQLDWATGDMLVTYDHDAATQQRQQEAIMAKVDEIVAEIITPGMTDLEIQLAINNFLIEHATYDFTALENAEQNNFMFVDQEFYDSFTAYGILINGVGVCSGYADAFTLIADRSGLQSVFVTGYLNGNLPHAWNRVYIDGEWLTLDVTNNDNPYFPNAFFNLSDAEAATVLVEDSRWILNSELPRFVGNSSENVEYYRRDNRFFDQGEIVDVLVEGIRANGRAIYRTDVMLTEEQFRLIHMEVALRLDSDVLGGFFLGVIHMTE